MAARIRPLTPPLALTTAGLLLRPFREADEPAVAEALDDPEILRWAVGDVVATAPVAQRAGRWLRPRIAGWTHGTAYFAVTAASDGTLLGSVGIREIGRFPEQAAVTYWVTAGARGRGVATRALRRVSRWAFAPEADHGLGLHRLWLDHAGVNPGSCRVATRAGFRFEGVMREFYREVGGRRHDSHLHARLATDDE